MLMTAIVAASSAYGSWNIPRNRYRQWVWPDLGHHIKISLCVGNDSTNHDLFAREGVAFY